MRVCGRSCDLAIYKQYNFTGIALTHEAKLVWHLMDLENANPVLTSVSNFCVQKPASVANVRDFGLGGILRKRLWLVRPWLPSALLSMLLQWAIMHEFPKSTCWRMLAGVYVPSLLRHFCSFFALLYMRYLYLQLQLDFWIMRTWLWCCGFVSFWKGPQ